MTEKGVQKIREAIVISLPAEVSQYGKPELGQVYVPPSHLKALRLECSLAIGGRGVGKTFWSMALQDPSVRAILGRDIPELAKLAVYMGFGGTPNVEAYPDANTFKRLLIEAEAYDVWRAVVSRWLAREVHKAIPRSSWEETVSWVKQNPEEVARLLEEADKNFSSEGRRALIVFDALDRSSHDWQTMDRIVRDLLRVVLDLRGFSCLHAKVFLREDQFHRRVADFPDASKLLATRVELTWGLLDLHGLLWQYLCNGPGDHGTRLRDLYSEVLGKSPLQQQGAWQLHQEAKKDERVQRKLFERLAGPWMGRDRRRGIPYTWVVNHLADGKGRVSPRSLLAAIRVAAEDSRDRYVRHPYPLHYESIKRGVQSASQIRVAEMAEDYPWVKILMDPLRGLVVPCRFEEIEQRWSSKFGSPSAERFASERLPPEHWQEGWAGIRQDLEALGILETMWDGRVNMPDIYRVGFGLGRRGGVKPVRKEIG